ncbi:MAG: tetratricopeptide repeat protein [Kiritimatiellae bacterium]|nr:tetratricopeptide repeat protein [Kiritimatiellia bacterium]
MAAVAAAGLPAGCRTLFPQAGSSPGRDQGDFTRQDARMAEALANYAAGVLREGRLDSAGAVSNYLRAAELEPEIIPLYLRVAAQHIKRAENDKAIAVMEEACRVNPRSADAAIILSQVYQIINQPEKARAAARRAIEIDPANNKGYIQLASLYISGQDAREAARLLRAALPKLKEPLPVLRIIGDLHAQMAGASGAGTPDFKEAIYFYEKAAEFPADDLAYVYLQKLGDFYMTGRQIEKALECFRKIAVRDPDNVQIQQKIALCHVALGNREKALETLEKIAGRDAQNPDIYYYLGELYDSLGDRKHAIENLKAARDAEPTNPKSYLKMAVIHLRNDPQKASEILKDGLKKIPRERAFLEILVQIYLQNRQYNEALALFDQMQSNLSPDDPILRDPRFYIHYAMAAQQCRLFEKAADLYSKALEIAPDSLETRVQLAALHIRMKNPEEALALMETAVLSAPDDPAAWFFYAMICSQAGEYKQAAAAFGITEKKAQKLPDRGAAILDSSFYFNYGAAGERTGENEMAERNLAKSIELDPENSDAFNYLAYMWAEKNANLELALDYIRHALDFEPDNGAYLDTLGWILFKQEKHEEALENIQNARALMPYDPTIQEHLGDVLSALGRKTEALEAWKQSFLHGNANSAVEKKLRERGIDTGKLRRSIRNEEPFPAGPEDF